MMIEKTLWYKTIDLRILLLIWLCAYFAPLLLIELEHPIEFDGYLIIAIILINGIFAIRATIDGFMHKNLFKVTRYCLIPVLLSCFTVMYK
jgi:hypothetical protein